MSEKYVLRFMDKKDVAELLGEEVFLLWPDDGLWYPAEVIKVNEATNHADVIYTTTDEQEDIDLNELINDRSIALREPRPASHKLGPDEIWDTEDRSAAKRRIARSDSDASMAEDSLSRDEEISEGEEGREEEMSDGAAELEEDQDRPPEKRRRVSGESSGGRSRRLSTMSGRSEALLKAEKSEDSGSPGRGMKKESPPPASRTPRSSERKVKDEFSAAELYEQQLISQISGSHNQRLQLPKKSSGLGQSQFYGKSSGGTADAHVREKVAEAMTAALDKVSRENKSEVELPSTAIVAAAVEQALFDFHGNAGKDYKAKYRSLIFNLRDDANPDLRRRVLTGDIPADKLVTFSHNELASKQLSQWREEKEAEAMKNAVLDTQAAARFSTAAALASKQSGTQETVDWRDNTLATRSPPRDHHPRALEPEDAMETVDEGRVERMASGGMSHQDQEQNDEKSTEQDGAQELKKSDSVNNAPDKQNSNGLPHTTSIGADPQSTAIRKASFDWSTIRANALQEKTESDAQQELKADDDEDDEEYDPENEHFDDDAEDRSEAYKVLASQVSVSTSNRSSAQEKVWQGLLGNACPVPLPVSVHYLAGNQAFANGLPQRQTDMKGRVQLDKAEEFMKSLKASRSRTLSLGLMSLSEEVSAEEKEAWSDLERQYVAKERCGVFPEGGIEYYLIAKSTLASGLMEAAQKGELPPHQLLVVAVHLKTLISGHSRASNDPEKSSSFKPKSPAQAPKIEEVDLGQPQSRPQLQQRPTPPPPGPNGISNPMTNARPPQAAAERAAAENAAQTLAAALNSGQHNEATTDPRLNMAAAGPASDEEIASQLMMPQGIDLSSLGNLAAVLGVSQGLNLLVGQQKGAEGQPQGVPQPAASQASFPGGFHQQPPQQQQPPAGFVAGPGGFGQGIPGSPQNARPMQAMQAPQDQQHWAPNPRPGMHQAPAAQPRFNPPPQYPPAGQHFQAPPNLLPQQVIPGPPGPSGGYPGPPHQHMQQQDPNAGRFQPQQQMPGQWPPQQQFQRPQGQPQQPRPITLQPPRPSGRSSHPRPSWRPPRRP